MKTFQYEAMREPGHAVRGTIEAEEAAAAASALIERGFHVLRIEDAEGAAGTRLSYRYGLLSGFRRRDQAHFSRGMATLLRAGLPLTQSLGRLRARESRKSWRTVIGGVQASLEAGQTFSQALAQYPGLFDDMYVNLVRAGEEGGTVADVLQRLADVGEYRDELRSKVSLAFVYPLVMLGMGATTVTVLLAVVVPMFAEVFEEMGQNLPWPTLMLVVTSGFVQNWWWALLPGVGVAAFAAANFLRRPVGVQLRSIVMLRTPRLGKVAAAAEVSGFARTLGMLLDKGVPMVRALEITAATLTNHAYRQDILKMRNAVREGIAISRYLDELPRFPAALSSVASVGEASGTLPDALLQIADDYDRDLEREVKVLTTLMEPIMIIVVGSVVGFIVAAIILPIFQLGDIAQP